MSAARAATQKRSGRWAGLAAVVLAIGFNVPYVVLADIFHYPDILRQPPGQILQAFAAGGETLVWTWWAFGLCALAQTFVACAMLAGRQRWNTAAVAAAVLGSLAGLTQAIGLWRWTFAVPGLADAWSKASADHRPMIEMVFSSLHQFGGVAIGEHAGQWLTAAWILALTHAERRGTWGDRIVDGLAWISAGGIVLGAFEGLGTVIGGMPPALGLAAPIGYAVFTLWLISVGGRRVYSGTHQ